MHLARSTKRTTEVRTQGSRVAIAFSFEGERSHGEPNGKFVVLDTMSPDQAIDLARAILEAASVAKRSRQ